MTDRVKEGECEEEVDPAGLQAVPHPPLPPTSSPPSFVSSALLLLCWEAEPEVCSSDGG